MKKRKKRLAPARHESIFDETMDRARPVGLRSVIARASNEKRPESGFARLLPETD